MGNGYRKIIKDASSKITIEIDCEACNNQGEIKMERINHNNATKKF